MKKVINWINYLVFVRMIKYDDGTIEKKLHVHPIIYFVVLILLIGGGYFAY